MFRSGLVRRATLAAVVGLALSQGAAALAQEDRPLPEPAELEVGLDDAVTAVEHAFPSAKVFDASISRQGEHWVYMVKALRGSTLRTIKYDCTTGERILNKRETVRGQRLDRLRQQVQLLNTVVTTKLEAIQAAEAAAPGAKAYEVELDDLNDQPVFKVKLLDGTRRIVVIVSAGDGSVMPQPGDGVVNLSFDTAVTTAEGLFPDWSVVKIELDDDRDFDDSGSFYNLRLVNSTGTQRRDIKLNANTGGVRRDRLGDVSEGNVAEFAQIAASNPAISFGAAGKAASDSISGSRIHEIKLKIEGTVLVYEVELTQLDGTSAELFVNATTGDVSSLSPGDDGSGGTPGGGDPGAGISSDDAVAIAMARFPGSTLREVTTDTEHGAAVYEVSLIVPGGTRTDVKIDQSNGAIVKIETRS